jgi:hypothetical protein
MKKILLCSTEIILFTISCLVLAVASADQSQLADWIRLADGVIACILCLSLIPIVYKAPANNNRVLTACYQLAIGLFVLIILIAWIYRQNMDFNIFLPGLAWRMFWFLQVLPIALTAFNIFKERG